MPSALDKFGSRKRYSMRDMAKAKQKQQAEIREARRKERAKEQYQAARANAMALGGSLFGTVAEGSAQLIYQQVQSATQTRFSKIDAAKSSI